jgi:hypothetical protein
VFIINKAYRIFIPFMVMSYPSILLHIWRYTANREIGQGFRAGSNPPFSAL